MADFFVFGHYTWLKEAEITLFSPFGLPIWYKDFLMCEAANE